MLLLTPALVFAGSIEARYIYAENTVLEAAVKNSAAIIRGKVISHKIEDSDDGLIAVIATIKILNVLKGPILGEHITLNWKEAKKSVCPHIPIDDEEFTENGLWLVLTPTEKIAHGKSVEWLPPGLEKAVAKTFY